MPLLEWHIKSTTKAQQGLYEYDAVSRLRDSQARRRACTTSTTTSSGECCGRRSPPTRRWSPHRRGRQGRYRVPNDLLREVDRMEFYVYETRERRKGDAPADRVHHLEQREGAARRACGAASSTTSASDKETMEKIVSVHFPTSRRRCCARRWRSSSKCARCPGLKKPSTSELLDWLKLLLAEYPAGRCAQDRKTIIPPLRGALLKNEQDVHLFERLVFMTRAKA